MKRKNTVDFVKSRFDSSEQFVKGYHSKWEKYYELYRAYRQRDNSSFSNLFIPHTFSVIEQILPRIISGILGSEPAFSVSPRKPEGYSSSKVMEALIDYQIKQIHFHSKFHRVAKEAFMYGTSFAKSMWDVQEEEHQGEIITQYNGPSFEYVSAFSLFPDPYSSSIKDAEFVIERYFVTKTKLKEWEKQGIIGPESNGEPVSGIKNDISSEVDKERFNRLAKTSGGNRPGYDETREWIEIYEYWEKNRTIMVANDKYILRNDENPFKTKNIPYFDFRDYPVADEFYGIGEVEIIEDLQEEINTQRNQRIDARSLSLNPIIQVAPGGMIDDDEIIFEPGRKWHVDPGMVQPFALPDTGVASVEEEMIAANNIKETTSVTDIVRGQATTNTPQTATGVSRLDVNATTRFNLKVRSFDEPLTDVISHFSAMNQQFIAEEQVVKFTGELWKNIPETFELEEAGPYKFLHATPADIAGNFDFDVKGAKSVNQMQRQQKYMQLLQIAGQFPTEINIKEIVRRLLESLEVKDIYEMLEVNPEQVERLMEAKSGKEQLKKATMEEDLPPGPQTREQNVGNTSTGAGPLTPEQANQQTLSAISGAVEGGV